MAMIQISDELGAELQAAAARLGRTKDEFVSEAVLTLLEEHSAPQTDFSDEQIARMKHSIAQLDRGEVVTSEQVDKKFGDWRRQRASR